MSLPRIFHILIGDKSATLDNFEVLPDKVVFHARIKKKKEDVPVAGRRRFNIKILKKGSLEPVIWAVKKLILKSSHINCSACPAVNELG